MKTLAIIQARMGSSRLPGKVLAELGEMPVLAWVVRAARASVLVDHVMVATTEAPGDDAIAQFCGDIGVDVVRGPEDDVLTRFMRALSAHPSDFVVRLTADCPFLDPRLIDATISLAASPAQPDFVSTTLVRTLPRGLDVEVCRAVQLAVADRDAVGHHRAHVTSFLYTNPNNFTCLGVSTALDASDLRVTVDTPEDLTAVRAIVGEIGTGIPRAARVVSLLRSRPDIVRINAHIEQKALDEG